MEFIGGLIPIFILVAILFAVGSALSRRRRASRAQGIGARQTFFYVFAFAALMVAMSGISLLVAYIVDSLRGGRLTTADENQLAAGLALTLVGAPAWLLTWRRLQKAASTDANERNSFVRGLYIYLVAIVSVSVAATGLVAILGVILGADSLGGSDVALPAAWLPIWAYHWWIESKLTAEEKAVRVFRHFYIYLASMAFLIMLLVGLGIILGRLFDRAYVELFLDEPIISSSLWSDGIKTSISMALVGGLGWWWHWFRSTETGDPSTARQIYIHVFGVLFGVVTTLVSVTLVLVVVFQWVLSTPSIDSEGEHFRAFTGIIPALLTGIALWGYHSAVLGRESQLPGFESARRIYNYLVTSMSLATLAVGLVFLISLFVSATVREAENYLVKGGGWQGHLSIVLPLLLVGGGTWAYYWRNVQRTAAAQLSELATAARRIHIYSVFGVAALSALGSLSATLYMIFNDILDSELSGSTLKDAQWAIGILLASGVISAYYLLVIRDDRRALAGVAPEAEAPERKRVTVMVPEGSGNVVDRLEERLGYEVSEWVQAGDTGLDSQSEEQISAVVAAINAASTEHVLVLPVAGALDVRPYRRG